MRFSSKKLEQYRMTRGRLEIHPVVLGFNMFVYELHMVTSEGVRSMVSQCTNKREMISYAKKYAMMKLLAFNPMFDVSEREIYRN